MLRRAFVFSALIFSVTAAAQGQTTARAAEAALARAHEVASDGNGAGGRALIDSIVRATPPASPVYPQALFWRASLAANAADAESDYKHIVVDYPLAPQAEDALLRLAQLELARGDKEGALIHLQKIPRDYPRSRSLARASYWTARVLFEKNDIPNACAANANALAQAGEGEIELRNQIQYQGQRCPLPAVAVAPAPVPGASAPPGNSAASTTASSTPTSGTVPANPPATERVAVSDTVTASVAVTAKTTPPVQRPS